MGAAPGLATRRDGLARTAETAQPPPATTAPMKRFVCSRLSSPLPVVGDMEAKKLAKLHAELEEGATSRGAKTGGLGFDAKGAKAEKAAAKALGKKGGGTNREFAATTAGE